MAIRDFFTKFRRISYMPGQVLVAGPKGQIAEARQQIQERHNIYLQPALGGEGDTLNLGDVSTILNACPAFSPTQFLIDLLDTGKCQVAEGWAVDLYRIPILRSVRGVVGQINALRQTKGLCILAGPNYLLGYPHTLAGSPHTLAGSPHTLAGSPYTAIGDAADPAGFYGQWAFEHIGLVHEGARNIALTGHKVQVGVFDTCPFKSTGVESIGRIAPPLNLTVSHPPLFDLLPVPSPVRPLGAPPFPDLSDHGLSVSGLVHGVAPESEIHLYRVLDRYARGNLFVLASALLDFMQDMPSDPEHSNGRVINLSLGVPRPQTWDPGILILEIVLALAFCDGIVIAAAGGNGSSTSPVAQPMEFPAEYPYTLGVAASNYERERACFSNMGQVAAPGGDGLERGCAPASGGIGGGREKYGLISLVSQSRKYPDGYGLCTGTSFATPLVAGQAALILEALDHLAPAATGGEIPAEVFRRINRVTGVVPGLGTGMIDLPSSLLP